LSKGEFSGEGSKDGADKEKGEVEKEYSGN